MNQQSPAMAASTELPELGDGLTWSAKGQARLMVISAQEIDYDQASQSFKDFISDSAKEFGTVELGDAEFGRGASIAAVMVVLTGLFFLGKRIEENLDSWLRLGAKLHGLFLRLREKSHAVYLSPEAGRAVGLSLLSAHVAVKSLQEIFFHDIPVDARMDGTFRTTPERFYICGFRVNDADFWIVILKSNGESVSHQRLDVSRWRTF